MIQEEYIPNSRIREIDALMKETFDCREGVLLDSYIGEDKEGNVRACLVRYETSRSSGYLMITGDEKEVWERWEAFCKAIDEEDEDG